jgi:guanylate cyclase soluble subunit beta
MYGWINGCIRDLVLSKFGEEKWSLISEKSGCGACWIKHEYYPDKFTFDLVGAGCEVLGVEGAELLEVFGQYFITYCTEKGYANLLRCLGSNLREWLSNVNMLHVHLESTLPEMVSPQFW